jgi:hypothetical protein
LNLPAIEFDPGATAAPLREAWSVKDETSFVLARFAFREDAELFEAIIKRRPFRCLKRELR